MFLMIPLLEKIQTIQGWLDFEEADLLLCSALKGCLELSPPHAIVEIGSFHGKSTVLLGTLIKSFFQGSKVYAIDPHEGLVGAHGQDIKAHLPSLESFKQNISLCGLNDTVELIKDCSYNIKWDRPITFLFIDGLHDYTNVARDFNHFSRHIINGGYVAFHDYGDYYPGVKKFVEELQKSGTFNKISVVKSLIVLQKTS